MANKPIVDFEAIKNNLSNVSKPIQVLNENAEITDQEVFDSFSDEDLVEFMKKMVWERALHEQTMNFSRQ